MFNSKNREGAAEEASDMEKSLVKSGFETKTTEWREYDLFLEIRSQLTDLTDLSLLVISIMSHGTAGSLTGNNNCSMSITDLLGLLSELVPKHIPLVSLCRR